MKACTTLCFITWLGLISIGGAAYADDDVFAGIPFRDPKPLEDLVSLDNAQFQNVINTDFGRVQTLINTFLPPQSLPASLPLSFIGARNACLKRHVAAACRVHLQDLITIHRDKQQSTGVLMNPFSSTK